MSLRGWKLTLSRKVQAQSREEALGMGVWRRDYCPRCKGGHTGE